MGRFIENTISCIPKGLGDHLMIITHHITTCFPHAWPQGQTLCSVLHVQHLCWSSSQPVKVVLLFLRCGHLGPWKVCLLFKLELRAGTQTWICPTSELFFHCTASLGVLMGLGPGQVNQHPRKLHWAQAWVCRDLLPGRCHSKWRTTTHFKLLY